MSSLIEFDQVSKKINNQLILEEVSFKILPSTITVLIGPNGAGKTTIARLLLGIDKPTTGRIINKSSIKLGYTPQKAETALLMPLLVKNLIISMNLKVEQVRESPIIESAAFDEILLKPVMALSGGQLQRLLLACNFAKRPELIVLDEPTSNLDTHSKEKFYQLLDNITQAQVSIFMISHDLHTVIKSADQILCLNRHICCKGRPFSRLVPTSNISYYEHTHDHNHPN